MVDDPEVDASTGFTRYQLSFEEMNLAAFSYSNVVGSPGIVTIGSDDVPVWASANGILHKRDGGKRRVQNICHTSFGCKYVFEDDSLASKWVSSYAAARNAALITIGVVVVEALVFCVYGAIAASAALTPAAALPGCLAGMQVAFPAIISTGAAGLVTAAGLYFVADVDLHNQWALVDDMRPIRPWRRDIVEPC
ncbi:MAG: hypothetical protein MI924_37145 [Chloroflexales bacterium]|nr:hypothetical protein [Chloroflexales bacterium]